MPKHVILIDEHSIAIPILTCILEGDEDGNDAGSTNASKSET